MLLQLPCLLAVIFSTPLAALAVAGGVAAVPVIIHLLNRKRYLVVAWAAMRFLLAAQRKNVRRLRLEQWFLLAIRICIGVLIVTAMSAIMPWAEPLWQQIIPGAAAPAVAQGRTHRIIVIDGSFSMAAHFDDDSTRFDSAKVQAFEILRVSAAGDGYSVVFLSSPAQVVVQGPADDRDKVRNEIEELKLPHGSTDLFGGLRLVADMVNRPLGKFSRREVIFITDLKKSSWPLPSGNAPALSAEESLAAAPGTGIEESWRAIAKAANLVFVDAARSDVDNLAVTSVVLGDPLPMVRTSTSVSAVINNFGTGDRKKVPVELRIGSAPKAGEKLVLREVEQKIVDVPARGSITVTFALENQNTFRDAGEYVIQVKAGEDALRLDDVRSLAATVRETIPVLVVNGKFSAEPLDTPGEIVSEALSPSAGWNQHRDKFKPNDNGKRNSSSPVAPDLVNAVQFADRFRADLAKYDCVFLCDLPSISGSEKERLEAHLQRGGCVFISLGPNAAQNIDNYNRVLYDDGKGLLPGRILGVKRAQPDSYFSLSGDEDAFKQAPLTALREDKWRAALSMPQFHEYVRIDVPANGSARRILSFLPVSAADKFNVPAATGAASLDPAVLDFPRQRGRVIIYTSTFNPERIGREQFWSTWASHPTFLPFLHETLRFAVAGGSRRNLLANDPIDEYVAANLAGLTARLMRSERDLDTEVDSAAVTSRDDAAIVHFGGIELSGIYRMAMGSVPDTLFAVNVPTTSASGGSESDLRRLTAVDLRSSAPDADIQLVAYAGEIQARSSTSHNHAASDHAGTAEPRGTAVAHFLLLVVLALMFAEVFLAWYYGSARSTATNAPTSPPTRFRLVSFMLWVVPAATCFCVLAALAHAVITDEFLGFLPGAWRQSLELSLGVPPAAPGEGTRWRLKAMAYITGSDRSDRWLIGGLVLAAIGFIWFVYRRERLGYEVSPPRRFLKDRRVGPALLRISLLLLTLLVLLPQLRLSFERVGWPDVVIVFDDSLSMGTVEPFHDPLLRAKTEELKEAWGKLAKPRIEKLNRRIEEVRKALQAHPSPNAEKIREELVLLEKKLTNLRTPHRLNLIKALLASSSQDWLQSFVRDRQMRVHIYRASVQATRVAELNDPAQCEQMLEEIIDLIPEGESSHLGDALATILKAFRGGSVNAVIMFTDGNTPKDEELPDAARLAARMGVPLYFVGVGDNQPPPDISLSDLMAERAMNVKDNLMLRFQLNSQGPGMPNTVPVRLYEIVDGKPVLRGSPDKRYPVNQQVRLSVTPETPGDKKYVIEVPVQDGEVDVKNNRLEHEVHVDELKRLRVLFIEGVPRYEFRYMKTLFERESKKVIGNKSIELNVLLMSANREFAKEDESAIPDFPSWEVLRTYDVVIIGDVDPKQFPRDLTQVKLLADFVKERGGGLLMIAGEHFAPNAYAGTELGDVLPVATDGVAPVREAKLDDLPITETFAPRLTSIGQNHPIFRFARDDADNAAIWGRLKEMYWFAKGYRRKPSAEVLAVHPKQHAEAGPGVDKDELHPLVLQQFVGNGRVMFIGFDETWRWRFRQDEIHFNQFWIQTIRSLARSRVGRIEIDVGRKVFHRNDPIRVTVRFPEDAPAPSANEAIRVHVERRIPESKGKEGLPNDSETQTIRLTPKEGTRATYEALVTHTPEGEYQFVLAEPVVQGIKPKAEATILPPKGELDDVQLKERNLQQAAERSHGAYYPLDRANQLLADLPNGPRIALDQPCDPLVLWNLPAVFALVFALIGAEWLLRKQARLL